MSITERTIGYANARDVQMSLPSPTGRGSSMYVEPNAPILTPDGLLTGFQEALEGYVTRGLLRRLLITDAQYASWNDRVTRRKDVVTRKVSEVEPKVGVANIPLPPKMTISSDKGIQLEENRTTTNAALQEEVTQNNDGTFTYKGKLFPSKAALNLFKKGLESK